MCLLITQPEGVCFDEKFLKGVYSLNKDGIGVMYAEGNYLYHAKQVPKTFDEYFAFYRRHIEGKACAWHSRLQTHGPVEIKNAHPFEVLNAERDGYVLWLMHNGILHTDNLEDPSQTDTALYIKNYLRPMLAKNPEFFMTEAFSEIIGEHIGTGNKFVLLDAYGNQVSVNEGAFVDYNGAKLSNTYAWDTTGTEHDFRAKYKNYGSHWNRHAVIHETDDDFWGGYGATTYPSTATKPVETKGADEDDGPNDPLEAIDDFYDAVVDAMVGKDMDALKLSYAGVQDYYEYYGEESYALLELINSGAFTEEDVLQELWSPEAEVEAA